MKGMSTDYLRLFIYLPLYRVALAREQLEAEIAQGAAKLETDLMEKHQKSLEGNAMPVVFYC